MWVGGVRGWAEGQRARGSVTGKENDIIRLITAHLTAASTKAFSSGDEACMRNTIFFKISKKKPLNFKTLVKEY